MKLLLVDDEAHVREGICARISWKKLRITELRTAKNGYAGLELSRKFKPDIVLTDASGTELLSWQSSKSYASVVISCPEIVQGESYTIKAGTSEATVTMDSLIYGAGKSMGR